MKRRYRVKGIVKEYIKKILITLIIGIVDVVLYHYLGILGAYASETSWSSAFILVGWFWLLAGQFIWLYAIWE